MTGIASALRLRSVGFSAFLVLALGLAGGAGTALAKKPAPRLSGVQRAQVGDISMGYRTGGSGRPLVMIMGRSGTMTDWDPKLIGDLMRDHFVVVLDNRAVGTTTEVPDNTLSVAQMANDTAGLMDALGIAKADVLGWSMGGYIAQTLALNYPSKVRRLVLAATSPGGPETVPPLPFMQEILSSPNLTPAELFALSFPPIKGGLRAALAYLRRVELEKTALVLEGVPRAQLTLDDLAKAEQLVAVTQWKGPNGGVWDLLPGLRARTLVTNGNLDLIERPANGRRLGKRIPRADHCVFPATGHGFLFQEPDLYADLVNSFLAKGLTRKALDKLERSSQLRCHAG